jgi:hypothetical protein
MKFILENKVVLLEHFQNFEENEKEIFFFVFVNVEIVNFHGFFICIILPYFLLFEFWMEMNFWMIPWPIKSH